MNERTTAKSNAKKQVLKGETENFTTKLANTNMYKHIHYCTYRREQELMLLHFTS
jgi:hypothetical protein